METELDWLSVSLLMGMVPVRARMFSINYLNKLIIIFKLNIDNTIKISFP